MSARRLLLVALALAALATGCLGRSPEVEYFSLQALAAKSGAVPSSGEGLSLGVGPVALPRNLARPEIARRVGPSEITYDGGRRWAGSLDSELLRVLGANLAARLETDRVVVYPSGAPFSLTYRVSVDVERFEAGPDDAVTLRSRWVIRPGSGGGEAVAVGTSHIVKSARSGRTGDLVAAHSAAVDALGQAIADRIRALAAETPAS